MARAIATAATAADPYDDWKAVYRLEILRPKSWAHHSIPRPAGFFDPGEVDYDPPLLIMRAVGGRVIYSSIH